MNGKKYLLYILGLVTVVLLFPSVSRLPVFAKGEFFYLESVGIIFGVLTLLVYLGSWVRGRLMSYGYAGVSIVILLLAIMLGWIRFDVYSNCKDATSEYGGTCVEALSRLLQDESRGFRARNSAVWTLGQLADSKALPVLQQFFTGDIPDREPLDVTLSQYELEKAIRWCTTGNVTNWLYKGLL